MKEFQAQGALIKAVQDMHPIERAEIYYNYSHNLYSYEGSDIRRFYNALMTADPEAAEATIELSDIATAIEAIELEEDTDD